jgi:hypothetical protein
MSNTWLPLTDYSTKHKVSVSTLRRRIKSEDIQYCFQDGKYLLLDQPPQQAPQWSHRPSPKVDHRVEAEDTGSAAMTSHEKEEPILLAANKLLSELKQAYSTVLQEKEEQLLHMHEEVADLKTLVKVLESENARLRGC